MPAPLNVIGIDYSFSAPDYAAFKKAGIKYVCRYLSFDSRKNLTRPEYLKLNDLGIKVVLVWESSAGRALQGANAGRTDARAAATMAAQITGSSNCPIYFAVDQDVVSATQFAAMADYFRGVESAIGHARTGAYCEYDAVHYLHQRNLCTFYWQPAAWSRGKVHPAVHIYQRHNGVNIGHTAADLDVAYAGGYGAVGQGHPKPAPKGRAHQLAVWREHLKLAVRMMKLVGPTPELKRYAAKLRGLIRRNTK